MDKSASLVQSLRLELQSIPAWTVFNSLATKDNVPSKLEIGYCPVINASPTENLTVYTLLCRSITMARQADLPFTMVVLGQAIYAKAVDIVLQRPQEFCSVGLRMGAQSEYFLRIQKLRDFFSTVFLSKNLLNEPRQRLSSTTHIHVEVGLVDLEQILH